MILYNETDEILIEEADVPDSLDDNRLDSAIAKLSLSSEFSISISRNRAQTLIEDGHVQINSNVTTSKKTKVKSGDKLRIEIQKEEPLDVKPENIKLNVVYEDSDLIVVNKPKGMVVHPAPGNLTGTLVNALLYHAGDSLSGINGTVRPGIVHRIDKDTSGLIVVAKNDDAHRGLSEQFSNHSMERTYEAIVLNNIKEDKGTIEAPIGRDPANRLRNKVVEGGRHAVTHFEVMKRYGKYTYVRLNLETGRTHQIRVHMAHIGHPLLGDGLYSNAKNSFGVTSQMLHAKTLGFIHPITKKLMEFNSDLPDEFQRVLRKLGDSK